ncbi:hypothetical protein [Rheinheimera sp.]|uniref:hypothetical protein n=1 Tax=Rheinheimera sp. TaxID=1869214 RepID=UPI00307F1CCD
MSSTNGNVLDNEAYPTPVGVVESLLRHLVLRPGDRFLEPAKGEGNIYDRILLPAEQKSWAEIRLGVDYLTADLGQQDVIITNPPFSLTEQFIQKSKAELAPDGTMVYLQRANYLGTVKRVKFWEHVGFPNKHPVIVPRPRFVKGKGKSGDSCEYMWFIWDYGNRFPTIPLGMSHLITPGTTIPDMMIYRHGVAA